MWISEKILRYGCSQTVNVEWCSSTHNSWQARPSSRRNTATKCYPYMMGRHYCTLNCSICHSS